MDGSNAFRYAKLLGKTDAGVTPEDAFEYSKTVNDDIVFLLFLIRTGDAMFDENGKFVAKVKPGYNDLDWLKALERTGYRQEYTARADAMGEISMIFSLLSAI